MHILHDLIPITQTSLTITLFVLSMMLIIEYLNVLSRGVWGDKLKTSQWKQIILAALLGIIPGCLGAYTAVSLYVHNIIGTAALTTAMIATSGDEAFFMFSIIPDKAIIIQVTLFVIAIIAGFAINIILRRKNHIGTIQEKHFKIHENESQCFCFTWDSFTSNFKSPSTLRISLLLVLIAALVLVAFFTGHDHGHSFELLSLPEMEHVHPHWIEYTFIVVLGLSVIMLSTVNDHFLKDHLWGHIIKKHFLRILLWTFGTLLLLNVLNHNIDLEKLISSNIYLVLIIAVLIGIVPESGPHLFFLLLFASGNLPISILIANSIVQDGHGSLPLLAETRKGFFLVKGINIVVGLIVGLTGILAGF